MSIKERGDSTTIAWNLARLVAEQVQAHVRSKKMKNETNMETPQLCGHLRPLLDAILSGTNSVHESVVDAWPKCSLEVNVKHPIQRSRVESSYTLPDDVEWWTFQSPHYANRARGYYCNKHKHAISSP